MATQSIFPKAADEYKSRATIHAANLGLALAVVDAFAAENIDLSAFGLQRILLEPSIPTNRDAVRLARPIGQALTLQQIDALVARLDSIPFHFGGEL
ncbi:hypothetical protein PL263_04150 [Methylomonas sp. EFPC3]|uniref:hypothetical protein n=1 Tax=Methylomonas sp. EFPC3 TaxID=3021710 RepID=UPI0024164F4B|nr:hypothetical protein [Methylomonas sp. EFPC3]WFP51221.1 hypothetical protein PL263_04150 [Methylomonas sp. EFPC3]